MINLIDKKKENWGVKTRNIREEREKTMLEVKRKEKSDI